MEEHRGKGGQAGGQGGGAGYDLVGDGEWKVLTEVLGRIGEADGGGPRPDELGGCVERAPDAWNWPEGEGVVSGVSDDGTDLRETGRYDLSTPLKLGI